jgi:endogenous inhibitor of DNA gyrase (YacG/DUF329 family)
MSKVTTLNCPECGNEFRDWAHVAEHTEERLYGQLHAYATCPACSSTFIDVEAERLNPNAPIGSRAELAIPGQSGTYQIWYIKTETGWEEQGTTVPWQMRV